MRLGTVNKCNDNSTIIRRYFVCNREGYKTTRSDASLSEVSSSSTSKQKRKTVSRRCGCHAFISLRFAGAHGYVVENFIAEHTHPLDKVDERVFMKGSRKITYAHQNFIASCARVNIGPVRSFRIFKQLSGSYANVGATVVDFKNFKRDLNAYLAGADAQMVINTLMQRQGSSSDFYIQYCVDDDNSLSRLFWCDWTSKKNFLFFGDVVSADATYKTNRYFYYSICTLSYFFL